MEELKANCELAEPLRKLVGVLMTSCKAALADAGSAVASIAQEEEDERQADAKKQAADRKRPAQKGGPAKKVPRQGTKLPAALTADLPIDEDEMQMRTGPKMLLKWDYHGPFLLTAQGWLKALIEGSEDLTKSIDDFTARFGHSSVRTSEGRCQLRLPEQFVRVVQASFENKLEAPRVLLGTDCGAVEGNCTEYMTAAAPAVYAFTEGAYSSARFELRQLGSFRLQLNGEREVAMVNGLDVFTFIKTTQNR